MKLNDRDKFLAMLLPAIIIVAAYGLFFLRGQITERIRVEKSLADARSRAPTHAQIAAQRMEMSKLRQEAKAVDAKLKQLQNQWKYETAFCTAGAHRHDRIEKLTNLFNKYGLSSIEDGEAETSGKDTKLNASLESILVKITQISSTQKPQLRRIKFHGRFTDVHRVLDELATGEVLAIPVNLTMKTTPDTNRREWTLLVWV